MDTWIELAKALAAIIGGLVALVTSLTKLLREIRDIRRRRDQGRPAKARRMGAAAIGLYLVAVALGVWSVWWGLGRDWSRDCCGAPCGVFIATPDLIQRNTVIDVTGTTDCEYVYILVRPQLPDAKWTVTDQVPAQQNRRWAGLATLEHPGVPTEIVALGCNEPSCHPVGGAYRTLPGLGARLSQTVTVQRTP